MKLQQLRYFEATCRLGSISRAAESLHVSQPSVSMAIRDLEREIDEVLPRQLIVDCAGLTFMDSSGIAVLLRLWQRMEELEGTIQVIGLPDQPARVLRAAGLQRLFPLE